MKSPDASGRGIAAMDAMSSLICCFFCNDFVREGGDILW